MEYSYDEYSSDEKILLESLPRESPGIVDYIFQQNHWHSVVLIDIQRIVWDDIFEDVLLMLD
jgi:hypothetical protein